MAERVIEGDLSAKGRRFVIVAARFNEMIVERLVGGAIDTLRRHGATDGDLDVIRCPGSFELPLVAKTAVTRPGVDAVIALGALIRGGTPHFDYISSWTTKGLGDVSLASGVPVAFGVLTCDNLEQALERAGAKMGNKGVEAALAAIEMANLIPKVQG